MNCETAQHLLGEYFDGEVSTDVKCEIKTHLANCRGCTHALDVIRELAEQLASSTTSKVPGELWSTIESQLPAHPAVERRHGHAFATRRHFALAAGILLLIGLGAVMMMGRDDSASQARAATIDFGELLDNMADGPEQAFQRFVSMHDGRSISAEEAIRTAPHLDFDIPDVLPGGFRRRQVYALDFGDKPGIAACYLRGTDFLATIFHTPVKQEDFGTHRDYPCVIGKHRGHRVDVGDWNLVHLTDATTCHCVLSKLDEQRELPSVFAEISPRRAGSASTHGHP